MEPEAPAQTEELIWETIACERSGGERWGSAGSQRDGGARGEPSLSPRKDQRVAFHSSLKKNTLFSGRAPEQGDDPAASRPWGRGQRRPSSRRPQKPSDQGRALKSRRPREPPPPAGRARLLPRVPAQCAALPPPGKIKHLYLYYIDKSSISCNFSCNRESSGNATRAHTLNDVISLPCDSHPTPTKLTS